jgi:Xaa-Pro aminopeptidase
MNDNIGIIRKTAEGYIITVRVNVKDRNELSAMKEAMRALGKAVLRYEAASRNHIDRKSDSH